MNSDDLSEEKNSSDINNERRIRTEGILGNLTMRRVLQQNLIEQMNAGAQQQNRDNEETQQRYLLQQLQEEERQRQILQILQSRQTETQLRQLQQQQRGLRLQPVIDVADQVNFLTPAASLQLHLLQQRRNQQQMQQRLHEEELRRLQLQQLLLEQQERRQQQFQFIQMERDQASLQNISGPEIRNLIASLPMRGNLDAVGNTPAGLSTVEINRLQSAEFSSRSNITSPRNINLSLPMRRHTPSSNVGVPEVSGIDVARVQAAIFQVDEENLAVAAKESGNATESDASDAMVLPPWSETSAQLMKKMQKTDSKMSVAATKKKSPLRKKIVGMPKRPLHAYNIFFQEERQRILSELPSPPKDDEASKYVIGGKRKRRRRATHGKISFSSLAKLIGEKWKTIESQQREHYEQLAVVDLQRYHDEMDAYNAKTKDNKNPTTKSAPPEANAKSDTDEVMNDESTEDDDDDDDDVGNDNERDVEGDSMESDTNVALNET